MTAVVSIYKMTLAQKIETLESWVGECVGQCDSLPPFRKCVSCIVKDGLQKVADVISDTLEVAEQAHFEELGAIRMYEVDAEKEEGETQTLLGVPIHWTQQS